MESYTFAQIEFSATKLSVITSNVVKQARLERMAVARTFVQFIYANSFKHVPLTRSVENMARERVSHRSFDFFSSFFKFLSLLSPPFDAARSVSVYSKRAILERDGRETGHAEILRRSRNV